MQKQTTDKMTITGIHTFRFYDTSSKEASVIEKEIEFHISMKSLWNAKAYSARYKELVNMLSPYFKREMTVKNIVVTAGRSVLAQRLANTTTYTGTINYGALGSSSAAVNNADTQLGTEVFRKVVASASFTGAVAFIDFFYSKADTNGTYQEFATFIDGTGSANSGQLFTHLLTGGWVKTASESMTVSCTYTFS